MPLLRYRIGDLAEQIAADGEPSYIVHGRAKDTLLAADGSRVTTWDVDQCFADAVGIAHYELRQVEGVGCTLRYIPDVRSPTAETLERITARLEKLLQTAGTIQAEAMTTLVPSASGKFRLTCQMTADTVAA
jgi:phenylacetate-coenzyme A ligase PaaK-like adenylate-forming protein